MDSQSCALRARKNPGASVGMHDPQQHSGGKTQPLGFTDKQLVFKKVVRSKKIVMRWRSCCDCAGVPAANVIQPWKDMS